MKYFEKLFLAMVLLLTVSLVSIICFAVSDTQSNNFSREWNSAVSTHRLIEYSIQSSLLIAGQNGAVSADDIAEIGQTAAALDNDTAIVLRDDAGAVFCRTAALDRAPSAPDGETSCRVILDENGDSVLLTEHSFSQNGHLFTLQTVRSLSPLIEQTDSLWRRGMYFFLLVLALGCLFALLLARFFTRPITALREVSGQFAAGDYHARAAVRTADEVGDLAQSFNGMADTIEEKIHALEDAAERQRRFTANFAHEIKTPMTSIIGYADTLYQKDLPRDEVQRSAWYIMNEGMRLEALSFKLLQLGSLQQGSFTLEVLNAADLLRAAVETITPAAEKRGIRLIPRFTDCWIRAECDLFQTLLLNLLDNALKSGGDRVAIYCDRIGTQCRITIADTGRGIPSEELSHITEAFYMVDKSRARREHGAGLGLALAAQIAALHHAKLSYQSEPGRGTAAILQLHAEEEQDESC